MFSKIIQKIKNKELIKYFIWKTKLYRPIKKIKNIFLEFKQNPFQKIKSIIFLIFSKIFFYNSKKFIFFYFKYLKYKTSDINEHLEILFDYAKKSETIFETGVRGIVSSWALLNGLYQNQKNRKRLFLNDVDELDISFISKIAKELKVDLTFEWKNNLELNINENFDLIFIDTWHVYAQLKRELQKFSKFTNKYIILHDTSVDGEFGEAIRVGEDIQKLSITTGYPEYEISKGLWPAVVEFIDDNPDWVIEKRFTNCNGLTILKKI
jgi:hypothetical protein